MLLKLKVTEGSNAGKEIIINSDKFLIGRADECNLRPHSDAISRRHCVIIKTDKVVGVRDLKSRNGTEVNGEKITGDKRLKHGDRLTVGPLQFEVMLIKTEAVADKPKSKSANVESSAMGGMVSQWLEEADDVAQESQLIDGSETREYRFDETSRIDIDTASIPVEDKDEEKDEDKKKKKTQQDVGKLPKFSVKQDQPKDTHEAASQVLRKLFNRG